ncbi:hypothetical protein ANO11243_096720 [Dothideomycetidae sp. 11243]|nr:hypothetical protein ANO11243_096720 [fungal sp. No.11243]
MPLPTVSFVLGVGVLLYLSTFVLFALLRIITGISIQRVSYSGLRRIAFSPRDGVSIRIRGIGFSLHRPTFGQPTWISLTLTEPRIIVDLAALNASRSSHLSSQAEDASSVGDDSSAKSRGNPKVASKGRKERAQMFSKLIEWKEKIKRLHRQIDWLSQVDLNILRFSLHIKDVGSLRVERLMLSVDTRPKTVDRSRLFQHRQTKPNTQRPAEWRCIVRSLLLTTEGKESIEVLDHCILSIHGFLVKELDGLRDASIALKMGRTTVPFDDIEAFTERLESFQTPTEEVQIETQKVPSTPIIKKDGEIIEDSDIEPLEEETAADAINDSKEFANSILRGIQEVQMAVSFFGLSKRMKSVCTFGQQVYFNVAMKEVGLDLMRLDSRSPAHRQHFSPKDAAHQALLTAISIAAGVDDGHEHPERMLYIPMVTATVKTTLPAKILQVSADPEMGDKNTNILLANLVCTSPSIDLDPKHLPLLLTIARSQREDGSTKTSSHSRRRSSAFLSKLLPKAVIKIAVQEPVIRVTLPHKAEESEYDMIISSVSSMAMDIDAQHDAELKQHYALSINYRHTDHRLYGQTFDGVRHELLFADTVELKLDINAFPETTVMIAGKFQNFSLFLTEPELCEGLRQIVLSAKKEIILHQKKSSSHGTQSFLRKIPAWLHHVHVEGSDFDVEITTIEPSVSKYARGASLHLASWSVEHKINREEVFHSISRRRSTSRVSHREQSPKNNVASSPKRRPASPTDGRRLAVHIEGLEGLIIDSINDSTGDPFLALPLFEVAFSTSTDAHGPLLHVNAKAEKLYVLYSLYNFVALGFALLLARKTFFPPVVVSGSDHSHKDHDRDGLTPSAALDLDHRSNQGVEEIVTVDFRAALIQIKAMMPADPPLMLQIYSLEAGQHRWATPFARTKLARMYAGTPGMQSVWSRIVSVKNGRLDLRSMRRKVGKQTIDEKSFDITAEGIRIGVPHQLVVHAIFDNITNVIKVHEQLHHNFVTGEKDYILEKHPEGPKNVPKISLRTQVLIFEIEDSPFEYKLGIIYRAGLLEQHQRLAREEAFRLKSKRCKSKRIEKNTQGRARSAHPSNREGTSPERGGSRRRSRSESARPSFRDPGGGKKLRYDTLGKCEMSRSVNRTIEQARDTLHRFNATAWKMRIDRAWSSQRHAIKEIRSFFIGIEDMPDEEDSEPIMGISLRPGMFSFCISDLSIIVDKPSFPLKDLPSFMHDVGKGMPLDMEYGLLIPMHLQISMGEAKAVLRDYPLPMLHIPAIRSGQSPRLPSLALVTNFVIAEEFRDKESQRQVKVAIVPKSKLGPDDGDDGYSIVVRRTVSPVKTYSNMRVDINTSAPTLITWSTAYQPVIQDMMQVIEGFTKPPIDPSEAVGFWDKIRLSFHSRIQVNWKGDGDVHLNLKGSRDPYVVTGEGSGFVMVWRNNVCWKIAQDQDPRKFLTVDSGDYILAIPDYDHYARHVNDFDDISTEGSGSSTTDSNKSTAMFKKVIMKLSGNVQWLLGLMFEQSTEDGERHFDFIDHFDVVLKHPDYAKCPQGKIYDAFRGFRSQHIHMSVAVAAPQSRDWNVENVKPSDNYNSVHLTPRFFTHFIKWWSLFSGVMSLPVRQGSLWGGQGKVSKKFGRHLATLKYNLLLSPVFISHMYKHKDAEDFAADSVAVTGLKMKIDSLMLDLHQRREYFEIPTHKGETKRTSSMKINQGQLDFISADFRAVSASVKGTSKEDVDDADEGGLSTYQNAPTSVDMSRFTIPDNDFTWIDMDDFVELDWILPQESNPETKILPLGKTPRFTYFRQTDHGDAISGNSSRTSPFGDEPTHFCVLTRKNDPRRVQADLIQHRLDQIVEQIDSNERAENEQELKVIRDGTDDQKMHEKLETLKEQTEILKKKHAFLHGMLKTLLHRLDTDDASAVPGLETQEPALNREESEWRDMHRTESVDPVPHSDDSSIFNNRFVVHNAQIKWNNSLRNIILRYIHQVGQRRGFVYYMSRRAVKFILDIVDEKRNAHLRRSSSGERNDCEAAEPVSPQPDDEMTVEDRIEQILADGRDFVEADDGEREKSQSRVNNSDEISTDFLAQNSYFFRLIAPQIQLQSEKNPKSAVLIAAKGMHLKVIQIMDKERLMDEISGLVQRRFNAAMDSMQIFVTSTKTFSTDYLHLYSGNRYGAKAGTFWPPWVPMEVMYEFSITPYGFSRVVQRTSASLKLDKYNNLRLKYNDDVSHHGPGHGQHNPDSPEHRLDHLTIEFPQFRAICDSPQYFAMYIIVVDLLLYSEPLEKTRSERLEKIMLASDFSDLTGAPELVEMLQGRIRQLEEIKMHFQVHEGLLDRQGWKDRISMDHDLTSCEDELFFMMKAITTSQQKTEDRGEQEGRRGLLHWFITAKELAWHLVRGQEQKFLEFQIRDTSFERTDNSDGSNQNSVEFGRINGYNFLPNAVYSELIAPYVNEKEGFGEQRDKMLRVQWLMMEAIAGIPVVDYFEVDLVPVQVQLERDVAKKLFEYIFPGVGGSAFEGSGFSPFVVKKLVPSGDDSEDEMAKNDPVSSAPMPEVPGGESETHHQGTGTGAGTLEQRLQPTLRLSDHKQSPKHKHKGLGIHDGHNALSAHWGIFQHKNRSQNSIQRRVASNPNPQSSSNLSALTRTTSSTSFDDTNTTASSKKKAPTSSTVSIRKSGELNRNGSKSKSKHADKAQSDDLTQMLTRASSYITLSYFHIHSLILCLSYKGQGKRNIEDVHDLVFRLPSIEYRNKTWSNLDLAMELKHEILRALIGHAGRIVGNKFRSAPKKLKQQKRNKQDPGQDRLSAVDEPVDTASTGRSVEHSPGRVREVEDDDHHANGKYSDVDSGHSSEEDDDDNDSNVSSDGENYEDPECTGPPTIATGSRAGNVVNRAESAHHQDELAQDRGQRSPRPPSPAAASKPEAGLNGQHKSPSINPNGTPVRQQQSNGSTPAMPDGASDSFSRHTVSRTPSAVYPRASGAARKATHHPQRRVRLRIGVPRPEGPEGEEERMARTERRTTSMIRIKGRRRVNMLLGGGVGYSTFRRRGNEILDG